MARASLIKVCTIDTCEVDHYAKGLCKPHYMTANRNKFNPVKSATAPKEQVFDYEDFWQFVKKELNLG